METKASRCFYIQLAIRSESRFLLFRGYTICEPQVKRLVRIPSGPKSPR